MEINWLEPTNAEDRQRFAQDRLAFSLAAIAMEETSCRKVDFRGYDKDIRDARMHLERITAYVKRYRKGRYLLASHWGEEIQPPARPLRQRPLRRP